MAGISQAEACQKAIQAALDPFGDGHLGISYSGKVFKPKKNQTQDTPVWPAISEDSARTWIRGWLRRHPGDSLAGIWESYEGFYRVALVPWPDSTVYRAFVLQTINRNWEPGQVKLELRAGSKPGRPRCRFFAADHAPEFPDAEHDRNFLLIEGATVFNRVFPAEAQPFSVESRVAEEYKKGQEFRVWSPEVAYLNIQHIQSGVGPLLDSLIARNKAAILARPLLVLDLRDNEGGDLTVLQSLFSLFMDRPARITGTRFWCTPQNVSAYRRQIEEVAGPIDPGFAELVRELERHTGGWCPIPDDVWQPEPLPPNPRRVVILIHEKNRSSVENFLLVARQSSRVVLAGQPTAGVVDFEETVDVPLPCPDLLFSHPIAVRNHLEEGALNGKGIRPEWVLPPSKSRAWQPWVREVVRRWKQEKRQVQDGER